MVARSHTGAVSPKSVPERSKQPLGQAVLAGFELQHRLVNRDVVRLSGR